MSLPQRLDTQTILSGKTLRLKKFGISEEPLPRKKSGRTEVSGGEWGFVNSAGVRPPFILFPGCLTGLVYFRRQCTITLSVCFSYHI